MARRDPKGGDDIVQRVNRLFDTHHPAGASAYSNAEIATRAAAQGYEISPAAIQQIRSGRRANPTVRVLRGLAAAFEVPITYFFEEEGERRDPTSDEIAARASEMSPREAQMLADFVQELLSSRPK